MEHDLLVENLRKMSLWRKLNQAIIMENLFFLPRIPFIPLQSDQSSIPFKRTQFPIRPCFAITINKAQGQTLDFVGLYLLEPIFCHGQLYVALSRAKTSKSLKVLINPSTDETLHSRCTKNVLYNKILLFIHP